MEEGFVTIQRRLAYAWGTGTTLSLLRHSELHLPFKVILPMVTVRERCQSQTVSGVMASGLWKVQTLCSCSCLGKVLGLETG